MHVQSVVSRGRLMQYANPSHALSLNQLQQQQSGNFMIVPHILLVSFIQFSTQIKQKCSQIIVYLFTSQLQNLEQFFLHETCVFCHWSCMISGEIYCSKSLVSTTEELLGRKSSSSSLENWEYNHRDLSRWPCDTLYPRKLALTSPINGSRSAGIVRSLIKAMELHHYYRIFW
jgi:hypothetical protein